MFPVVCVLLSLFLTAGPALPQQSAASAPEDAIQKTAPDRKLDRSDEACGHYLWISTKNGQKFLYYFFGSTEWGKSKIGFYSQNLYHVVVDPDKDPPTVQRLTNSGGAVSEIRIRMTRDELTASSACLAGH